jgi:hypothetical protein
MTRRLSGASPLLLVVVAGLLCGCLADDGPLPSSIPKPVAKKSKPKLSVFSAASLASSTALSSARLVAQVTAAATPYIKDPMRVVRLSANVKTFLPLFLVSVYFLWGALFGIFTFIVNPTKFNQNLIAGVVLYHASWFALRGYHSQMAKLMSQERKSFIMVLFVSLLSAVYALLKGDKVGSWLFGVLLLASYLMDLLKHVPGGQQVVNWIVKFYLSIFRWLLARLGLKFEPPQWMKTLGGVAPPPASPTDQPSVSSSVSSWFTAWLPSSLTSSAATAAEGAATAEAKAAEFLEREATAVLVLLGNNATLPPRAAVLGFRPVRRKEAKLLGAALGTEGAPAPFDPAWMTTKGTLAKARAAAKAAGGEDKGAVEDDEEVDDDDDDDEEAAEEAAGAEGGDGFVRADASSVWWTCAAAAALSVSRLGAAAELEACAKASPKLADSRTLHAAALLARLEEAIGKEEEAEAAAEAAAAAAAEAEAEAAMRDVSDESDEEAEAAASTAARQEDDDDEEEEGEETEAEAGAEEVEAAAEAPTADSQAEPAATEEVVTPEEELAAKDAAAAE